MVNLQDLPGMIRRRFMVILTVLILGGLATYAVALRQPHVYETVAVLQVELPTVSTEVGQSALVSRSSQRLQLLEQELLGREALLELAAKYALFEDAPGLSEMQKVMALRAAIRIETVRAGRDPFGGEQPVSAMLIVVRLGEGRVAADVANELANKVLWLTSERQSAQVRETLSFYASEDQRLSTAIAALEAEITAYKNANVDALPEGLQSRRDEVSRVEDMLRELDGQIVVLRQELAQMTARGQPRVIEQRQISALQSQLTSLEGQRAEAMLRRAAVERAVNRAPTVETELGTFARQLQQLQEQYAVITRRRAEAETSQRLDRERQTERFELLEKALPPDYPQASGRRKVFTLGMGVSLALGLALAYLLEMRHPVLRTARALERQLDLRPVIVLPALPRPATGQGPARGVGRSLLFWLVISGALLAAGLHFWPMLLARYAG